MGIKRPVKLFSKELVITTETISDSSSGSFIETVWRTFIAAFENGSLSEGNLLILRF
jgi:hypothetical protein